jgi:DEAD/DEAH box helicase domain-containing protein
VAFDIETQRLAEEVGGWGNIRKMGVAIAVVRDIDNDEWFSFAENDVSDLIEMLFSAELVIGFNSIRFDYDVLRGYTKKDFSQIRSLDLLDFISKRLGFRVSLQTLAQANFNECKSADGLQSVQWYREGRLDLVEEYCKKDVELTEKIYFKGLNEGFILFPSRSGELLRINVFKWLDENP